MTTPGRNDPCPCGSGAKYMRCCFVKESAPSPGLEWHDLDGRLVGEIARFARRRFGVAFEERVQGYGKICKTIRSWRT